MSSRRSQSEVSRLDRIIVGLRAQTATIEEQIKLQSDTVASVTRSYNQIAPVVEKGYVSRLEFERRHQAVLGERASLSRLEQQLIVARTDIARSTKERERAMLDGQNEQASAQSNLQGLFQQRSKIEGDSSYAIVAPVSGRVTNLQVSVGSTVAVAAPLIILIPDGAQLRADIFVPSRAIGSVRPGQEVRLLYDAFPYQRFGSFAARVETISRQAIAGQETNAPFKIDEPVYRVIVVPDRQQVDADGQRVALQPGMTLAANLVLDRRSFLDWISIGARRGQSNLTFMEMLNFAGGRSVPLVRQAEASECGLACLAMIAAYHGFKTDLIALRRRFPISLRGLRLGS